MRSMQTDALRVAQGGGFRLARLAPVMFALAVLTCLAVPAPARAAVSDAKHMVQTVSPSGTTISLFDYWNDPSDSLSVDGSAGINTGRVFLFNSGNGGRPYDLMNQWTGNSSPRSGILKNTLENGYPALVDWRGGSRLGQSLAYLFDSSAQEGKAAHLGVTGLLQATDDGYYEYDSTKNFAEYNAKTNAFNVYNKGGVKKTTDRSYDGQFFPFNAADQVFNEAGDGLEQKQDVTAANDGPMNHHFGLTMSSRFVQPTGGMTNQDQPMTFEFTGDDDVWVFIDDVLVCDLGGIHDAASTSINFATGDVTINGGKVGTIRSFFDAAGASTASFEGSTFKDGTQHTLKFYYLERGASDSNMKLKFNLVTVPESEIKKVDQDGDPVEGARFELYKADANYNATSKDPIASGTTDATGQLTLTSIEDNSVINFDDLYDKDATSTHYLLKETKIPDGYRAGLENTETTMYLEYVRDPDAAHDSHKGILVDRGGTGEDGYVWKNGAFTAARETITAPSENDLWYANTENASTKGDKVTDYSKDGTLFAVVLKRNMDKELAARDAWHAISGDALKGYTIQDGIDMASVLAAAKAGGGYVLNLNSSGQYQAEIPELPGDILKYYYLMAESSKNDAQYAVGLYYTTAGDVQAATKDNTRRLWGSNFKRQFSARLYVPNMVNRFYVQKNDGTGKYIAGAEFSLYNAADVTVGTDGKATVNHGALPIDTVTTVDKLSGENTPVLEGAAEFPSPQKKTLAKGTYYLKETKAPDGYKINDAVIKVIVDGTGVHADAGAVDDGVSTMVGVGRLVKTMRQFGAQNDINSTLTHILATPQTGTDAGTATDGKLTWSPAPGTTSKDSFGLTYDAEGGIFEYGPTTAGGVYSYATDTGWAQLGITQDDSQASAGGARTDLPDGFSLNQLFTGATTVRVTDQQIARLEITKTVTRADQSLTPDPDASFTFKFTLDGDDGTESYDAQVVDAQGNAVENGAITLKSGDTFTLKDGQTLRVFGLATGDTYTIEELTTKKDPAHISNLFGLLAAEQNVMPDGFSFVRSKVGNNAYQEGEAGRTISGTVVANLADGSVDASNKLEFVNEYKVTPTTLKDGFQAQKVLSGRDWGADPNGTPDAFEIRLRATNGTPMPAGAKADDPTGYTTLRKIVSDTQVYTQGDKADTTEDITGKDHTFGFGDIEYTKPGTYKYTVAEHTTAKGETEPVWLNGFGYSNAQYNVTVEVKDNGDGTLSKPVVTMTRVINDDGTTLNQPETIDNKIAVITNTYSNYQVDLGIVADKIYNDASGANPLTDGKFSFTLEALGGISNYDDQPGGADFSWDKLADKFDIPASSVRMPSGTASGTTTKVSQTATEDGTVAFPNITYIRDKDAGYDASQGPWWKTYFYKVTEDVPADAAATIDGKDVTYENASAAQREANDFSKDGMTYDGRAYYVIVYNLAWGSGTPQMQSYATYWDAQGNQIKGDSGTADARPAFTNAYQTTTATAHLDIQKTLAGRDWQNGDSFSFTVTPDANNPAGGATFGDMKNTIAGAGGDAAATKTFTYGTLTFTKPGTYIYTVTEDPATGIAHDGITRDTHSATVTYVVSDTDDGGNHTGTLTVKSATYNNNQAGATDADKNVTNAAAFTNTYRATGDNGSGIDVTKTMQGMALGSAAYTFNIEAVTKGAPAVPNGDSSFENPPASEGETVTMGGKLKLAFNQEDLGKTYVYKVSEANAGNDGNGYDNDSAYPGPAYVYITVKAKAGSEKDLYAVTTVVKGKNASDSLTAGRLDDLVAAGTTADTYVQRVDGSSTTAGTPAPTVPFVNTYEASIDYAAKGGVQITKTFTSTTDTGSTTGTFDFTVTPKVSMGTTQDGREYQISSAQEAGAKLGIVDGEVTAGKGFTIGNVALGSSGSVSLLPEGGLTFTQVDAGNTYTYEVKENGTDGTPAGYAYDTTVYTVTIEVKDNGNGTLTTVTTVTKPGEGEGADPVVVSEKTATSGDDTPQVADIPFANTYTTADSDTWTPQVKKVISGVDPTKKKFSFTLSAADDATKVAIADGTITADGLNNDENAETKTTVGDIKQGDGQDVSFSGMTFAKEGTYTFTVSERRDADDDDAKDGVQNAGWTMDTHVATVTVVVADDNAKLKATPTWSADNGGSTFSNSYGSSTTYGAQGGLKVTKQLNGLALTEGQFEFGITGVDGTNVTADQANAKLADADKSFGNVAPGQDGIASMSKLDGVAFDQSDDGKVYTYEVRETKGGEPAATGDGAGYTNDASIYTVAIAVHDKGDGTLYTVTTVTKNSDASTAQEYSSEQGATTAVVPFVNSYKSTGGLNGKGQAAIEATKTLDGRDMAKGEFHFEVKDAQGAVVATGTNAAAESGKPGAVTFGQISYSNLASGDADFPQGAISLPEAVASGLATQDGQSYTFTYTVSEKIAGLPDGVTPKSDTSFEVTVTVIDNGDGALETSVAYPGGSKGLSFVNEVKKSKTIGTAAQPTIDIDGKQLSVGDRYTYTIAWVNNAVDEQTGAAASAKVSIADVLPTGAKFVSATEGGTFYEATGAVVWDLGKQAPNATGTVSVTVQITDDAATVDAVNNTATITIGEHSYTTNTTTNTIPKKEVGGTEQNASALVGKELTYTIAYQNDGDAPSDITITDKVPANTEFVEGSASNGGSESEGAVTWVLKDVASGASGTVSFKVRVTEDAVTQLENDATVQIGENDPRVTNKVITKVDRGNLTISKTVETAEGVTAPNADFTFTVKAQDAGDQPLAGTYAYTGANGAASGSLTFNGGSATLTLKADQSVAISGLPAGATYTVSELDLPKGFTQTEPANNGSQAGTIPANDTATAAFTNTYRITGNATSTLGVTKTVEGRASNADFTFTVAPAENYGSKATVANATATVAGKDGQIAKGTTSDVASFSQVTFSAAGAYTFTVTEDAPADGWTSKDPDGHTVTYVVEDDHQGGLAVASISVDGVALESTANGATVNFTNTYTATPGGDTTQTNVKFSKVLKGRDWLDTDSFTFTLAAQDGTPLPKDAQGNDVTSVTVTKGDVAKDNVADFSFGAIDYTYDMLDGAASKTFTYTVSEEAGKLPGITYDDHQVTVAITVSDEGDGTMAVSTTTTGSTTFTNTYASTLDYGALGGLTVTKMLNGRDMLAGQFTFDVELKQGDGDRLGIVGAHTSPAGANGEVKDVFGTADNITFTQDDAGKSWTYTINEKNDGVGGYTYDGVTYTVTVSVADDGGGALTATTTVKGSNGSLKAYAYTTGQKGAEAAKVNFANSYKATPGHLGGEGAVQLSATKTLSGRPMGEGEFTFEVTNAKDSTHTVLATGANAAAAEGAAAKVTFSPIEYTSAALYQDVKDGRATATAGESGTVTYTYEYDVAEVGKLPDGVAGVKTSFQVVVNVTDNNDGTLSVAVVYPEGSNNTLAFTNTYGDGTKAGLDVNGKKVYETPHGAGHNAPDIAGKYTFTLAGSDGAPLPEKTEDKNDAAGNVDFGTITYTMENVFGDDGAAAASGDDQGGVRTKTFTYTVTESGNVEGVTNDAVASKAFTVTVTDNGDGTLAAVADSQTGFEFSFTNTYEVAPASAVIKGTKELSGRPLADAEFSFKLAPVTEGAPMPELDEVYNDAQGRFAFAPMTFGRPGTYQYTVTEVDGGRGGVAYDAAIYDVTVAVVDNGAGVLEATVSSAKRGSAKAEPLTFVNTYRAQPAAVKLGAAKVLEGKDLAKGQFAFELKDANGKVVSTARNNAKGQVAFGELSFDRAGEYTYTISEKNDGQANVTYDGTVRKVTVAVSETNASGAYDGSLHATVTYEDGQAPVFKNAYKEPPAPEEPSHPDKPEKPEKPTGSELPNTGDNQLPAGVLAAIMATGVALVGHGVALLRRRNRS